MKSFDSIREIKSFLNESGASVYVDGDTIVFKDTKFSNDFLDWLLSYENKFDSPREAIDLFASVNHINKNILIKK